MGQVLIGGLVNVPRVASATELPPLPARLQHMPSLPSGKWCPAVILTSHQESSQLLLACSVDLGSLHASAAALRLLAASLPPPPPLLGSALMVPLIGFTAWTSTRCTPQLAE